MKGVATREVQDHSSGCFSQKDRPCVRTLWKSVHGGILGIPINIGIWSPSEERSELLYSVTLRSESVTVLGYIYSGVSFVEGPKEDL